MNLPRRRLAIPASLVLAAATVVIPAVPSLAGTGAEASDTFTRSSDGTWGAADIGGAWSACQATCSVADGAGRVDVPSAKGAGHYLGIASSDMDMTVQVALDRLPAGGPAYVHVVGRGGAGSGYRAKLRFNSDGSVLMNLVRLNQWVETRVSSNTSLPAGSYRAGQGINVRVQAEGTSPTQLRAKLWSVGSAEPAWQVSASDSDASWQKAGGIGLFTYVSGAVTNGPVQVRIDNLSATSVGDVAPVGANTAPKASFAMSRATMLVNTDASLSSDAEGPVAAYKWNWGDGSTSTGVKASHRYVRPGDYVVTLTVADSSGTTSSTTRGVKASVPNAGNTGVPSGTALTRVDGGLTITTPGTVIQNKDIHGWVIIKAAGVTIRNSVIRGGKAPIQYDANGKPLAKGNRAIVDVTSTSATDFLIEDSKLVPEFPSVLIDGIRGSNFTARRLDISGTTDGAKVHGVGNVHIEDSFIHGLEHWDFDPYQTDGSHSDGVQVLSGKSIRLIGNSIGLAGSATTDVVEWNADVQVTQGNGAVSDLWINSNWVDGGSCSVNINAAPLSSISATVKDNRFGRIRKYNCPVLQNRATLDFTGNKFIDGIAPDPTVHKA